METIPLNTKKLKGKGDGWEPPSYTRVQSQKLVAPAPWVTFTKWPWPEIPRELLVTRGPLPSRPKKTQVPLSSGPKNKKQRCQSTKGQLSKIAKSRSLFSVTAGLWMVKWMEKQRSQLAIPGCEWVWVKYNHQKNRRFIPVTRATHFGYAFLIHSRTNFRQRACEEHRRDGGPGRSHQNLTSASVRAIPDSDAPWISVGKKESAYPLSH